MAYLPGVPDTGPAPVAPSLAQGVAKVDVGKPSGIAAVAHSVGKPGNTEQLHSVVGRTGKGLTSVGGGNPMTHSLNHYGKVASAGSLAGQLLGSSTGTGVDPTKHAGASIVRGESGSPMRKHLRTGGLGNGPMGMPGPSDQDVNTTQDTE